MIRLWKIGFITLSGIAAGLSIDFLGGELLFSLSDVLWALLMAPVAIPLGSLAVNFNLAAHPGLDKAIRLLFMLGGILFWPGYAVIAWRWWSSGKKWLSWVLFGWTFQGFCQIVHRLYMMHV